MEQTTTQPEGTTTVRCAICQSPLGDAEPVATCPACGTPYHEVCWQENGGCAIYGCEKVPPTEKWEDVEIPFSFWGSDTKSCPVCGQQIQAAAVRCRYCGATFASAMPEDSLDFQRRRATEERLPRVRAGVVWLFILSLITCSAPVAGIIALFWRGSRKDELKALPSLYTALLNLALWLGLGQTVFLITTVIVATLTKGK